MASSPPTGNSTTTKNVIVKITVEGDTAAIRAFAQLERANAQYLRAQNRASSGTSGFNRNLKDQDRQVRQNNQAFIQAGQQFQDFAVQLQGGQSIIVALTQQGAQLAFVMREVGGVVGTVARFFTGPWGTAIIIATAVLTPLLKSLNATNKELGGLTDKHDFKALQKELGATSKEMEELGDLTATWGDYLTVAGEIIQEYFNYPIFEKIANLFSWVSGIIKDELVGYLKTAGALLLALGKSARDIFSMHTPEFTKYFLDAYARIEEGGARVEDARIARLREELAGLREDDKPKKADKPERDREAEAWAELIAQWKQGGPAIAELNKEYDQLVKVRATLLLMDATGQDVDPVAYVNLEKRLKEIREELVLLFDPTTKLTVEFARQQEQTAQWAAELAQVIAAQKTATDPEYLKYLDDLYTTLNDKLNPALAEQKKLDDAQEKKEIATIGEYAAGGADQKRIQDQIEYLNKVKDRMGPASDMIQLVTRDIQELEQQLAKLNMSGLEKQGLEITIDAIATIADELNAAIEGSKSFGEAFEAMGRQVLKTIVELAAKWAIMQLVLAFVPGGSTGKFGASLVAGLFPKAKGGAFENGMQTFANGGIVSQPTLFPMAKGMGLMGEAGPEAIMPLTRGADGKLGVQGGGTKVVVHNYSGSEVSVQDKGAGEIAIIIERARQTIAADIARGDGSVSRSLQGTYGLSRNRR